ncbi:helix-turn-helix domain-containing protein [Nonomuraea basaltis]|uniref:helix-turn-helix domain-containing protein n=1 Tax=Nonomuraea basaltis TaxID=2495887 RepID=UPI00110C657B|nr:helix-turn-helix domain-containing protein [Nonomuraea basaltis]TMR99576.1 hypothetical protein EJK15_07115 [Nonomuraea basaltis]
MARRGRIDEDTRQEREKLIAALYREQYPTYAIAAQVDISERTVHRYLLRIEGVETRKIDHYCDWMPHLLAHLSSYPDAWFTQTELSRAVLRRDDPRVLRKVLLRMEREGLIVCESRPYNCRGDHTPKRHSRWYRLASKELL